MPLKRNGLRILFALFLGLIVILALGGSGPRFAVAAPAGAPALSIPTNIPALPGELVTLPVSFSAQGESIASVVFSMDYNQNLLSFDPTDSNGDGIPDRVKVLVPLMFSAQVSFDPSDTDGELDIVIADFSPPLASLNSGVLLEVTFQTTATPWESWAFVNFSLAPRPSFGNTDGFSVAGSASNGSVWIQGEPRPTVPAFLPLILKLFAVATPTPTSTLTPTPTATGTGEPTSTSTPTLTSTQTPTPTASEARTATPTPTGPTPTASASPTPTGTPTLSPTPMATGTPTKTPTPTPTATSTVTPSATRTPTPSATQTPTSTATRTATPSVTPTQTSTATVTRTPTVTPTRTQAVCPNLIANGGFEGSTGWTFPATACTAGYSTDRAYGGARSAQVGLPNGPSLYCYSSAYQQVSLPADSSRIDLDFYIYPLSSDVLAGPADKLVSPYTPLAWDAQYVIIYDTSWNELRRLLWQRSNTARWEFYGFDLTDLRGRAIRVFFGVYNDGQSGATGMYVDEVSLKACP